MRQFLGIILDLKRNFFVFLALFLITFSIPFALSYLNRNINIIGVVESDNYSLEIKGYMVSFYGQGETGNICVLVNNTVINSIHVKNGSFTLYLPRQVNNLTLVVRYFPFYTQKYVIELNEVPKTFAFSSLVKGDYISTNLSIISVSNLSIVASIHELKLGKFVVNSSLYEIRFNGPIYSNESWYGDRQLVNENKDYIIGLLIAEIIAIEILGYFSLSQFPRRELDEIIRLKGIVYVYLSKFISLLILGSAIFLFPTTLYINLQGLPITEIYQIFFVSISFIAGLLGIYQFLNSKEAALVAITLADYILDLFYFNLVYFCLLSLIFLVAGYFKIRSR